MDKLEERLVATRPGAMTGRPYPINPDGLEALAEITRLKGEVERLTHCANYEATMRVIDESLDGKLLAAKQALIDELVDGLEVAKIKLGRYRSDHPETYIGGVAAEYDATILRIDGLLARSSGKAGSDAGVER